MVILVRVPFIGQIDLFKKLFIFDRAMCKKKNIDMLCKSLISRHKITLDKFCMALKLIYQLQKEYNYIWEKLNATIQETGSDKFYKFNPTPTLNVLKKMFNKFHKVQFG